MKEIKLSQGKVALVDDEDYDYLNQWKWHTVFKSNNRMYAAHKSGIHSTFMHRVIMNTPSNKITDHIDHNGLNNQRSNLRVCTVAQNQMNKKPYGVSKYLGVAFVKGKFRSQIRGGGKYRYLGVFNDEKQAALAYNEAAKKYHGEFANLNIIENSSKT
jgi:hypothetical protein